MIDWKSFAILTTIRTVIAAGVTTGLCFLFPPAIPYLIGGNIAALTSKRKWKSKINRNLAVFFIIDRSIKILISIGSHANMRQI